LLGGREAAGLAAQMGLMMRLVFEVDNDPISIRAPLIPSARAWCNLWKTAIAPP
jgi:hypothetical protein